jgi:hypothetical protein
LGAVRAPRLSAFRGTKGSDGGACGRALEEGFGARLLPPEEVGAASVPDELAFGARTPPEERRAATVPGELDFCAASCRPASRPTADFGADAAGLFLPFVTAGVIQRRAVSAREKRQLPCSTCSTAHAPSPE